MQISFFLPRFYLISPSSLIFSNRLFHANYLRDTSFCHDYQAIGFVGRTDAPFLKLTLFIPLEIKKVMLWSFLNQILCAMSTFVMTGKYLLRGYILGVLTHTTALDRFWGGFYSTLFHRVKELLYLYMYLFFLPK